MRNIAGHKSEANKNPMSLVEKSVTDTVGTIMLADPAKRNALSGVLIKELMEALAEMADLRVRVVILRAAKGSQVWSAGHDVRELPTNGRDPLTYNDPLRQLVRAIKRAPVPIVAMVEGGVWGGACEVVMNCDFIVAAETATFAITPAKLGVPYDIAGVLNFMQVVPLPVMKEMLFTAKPIPADRALQVGLVNHVVPAERLETITAELAEQMSRNSPLVIGLLKEELRILAGSAPLSPEAFERIQALRRRIYDSVDYQEGIKSFFEKRAPRFQGK